MIINTKISSGVSVKQRRTAKLGEFRGIDTSVSSVQVETNRAYSMVNWTARNGVNHKRNGWEQMYQFDEAINGFWTFVLNSTPFTFCYAGTRFYKLNPDNSWSLVYTSDSLLNRITDCYVRNNQAYFIGCGDYLVYGLLNDEYTMRPVYNDPLTFVPTTVAGKTPVGSTSGGTYAADDINFLTDWRINTLIGEDVYLRENGKEVHDENENPIPIDRVYRLNGSVGSRNDIEYITVEHGENIKTSLTVSDKNSEGTYEMTGDGVIWGTIETVNGETVITFNTDADIVPLTRMANIEIKYRVVLLKQSNIVKCKYSSLYGVGGEADRLFLTNNDNGAQNNIIFFSDTENFTYFCDRFIKSVGSTNNEVQGFLRLSDGSMAAIKTLSINEPTIYVFSGEYIDSDLESIGVSEAKPLPKFSTSGSNTAQGIIAPHACSNMADDSMFLSQNGVYAIELSSGILSQRFTKERSLPINKLLAEHKLEHLKSANGITFNNKYYLAIDTDRELNENGEETLKHGKVYVADAHYNFTPDGSMADTFSYEWYVWDNMPVRTWFIWNNELWFGTADGRVCQITSGDYIDTRKTYFGYNNECVSNHAITVGEATGGEYEGKAVFDAFQINSALGMNGEIKDGDYIMLDGVKDINAISVGGTLLESNEFIISNYDKDNGTFNIKYHNSKNEQGEEVDIIKFVLDSGIENLSAIIKRRETVVSVWYSPVMDFGRNDYLKTLLGMTVTLDNRSNYRVRVGYTTKYTVADLLTVRVGSFSFNPFDFSMFTFDIGFQSSMSRALNIRNFNFITFTFVSDEPTDCVIQQITISYKVNTINRGLR